LKSNPAIVFKLTTKLGPKVFSAAMSFLGISPFALSSDSSKFIAIARLFNSPSITIGLDWAKSLYSKAKGFGYKLTLHSGHGWGYHVHMNGANGKLKNLHIQVSKAAYDYLKKFLKQG
jgi:hypothetical protein